MRAAHVLLFCLLAAGSSVVAPACIPQGAPVVAPVEVAEVGDAGPVVPLTVVAPAPPRGQCTARLRASPIKTNAGCTLDERISKSDGLLVFPCSGTGELEAVFGEHHFRGTVTGTTLQLLLTTELDWDDGCHWETQQSLRGQWRREGPHPKLVWSYDEHPVRGTSCFGSCKARADVAVDELPQ